MTRLLEDALRKVGELSEDEQNAIASQILETLEDEEAWGKILRKNPAKLRKLAEKAREAEAIIVMLCWHPPHFAWHTSLLTRCTCPDIS
jgi:hypothetical protein